MQLIIDTSAKCIDQDLADVQCVILFARQCLSVLQALFMALHTVTHATYSQRKIEIGVKPNTTGMGRMENFYPESLEFFPAFAFCASIIFTKSCLIPLKVS